MASTDGRLPEDTSREKHVLAVVSRGKERIIAYTEGKMCGMTVVPADRSFLRTSDTQAARPHDGEPDGSGGLPLGPYSSTSISSSGDGPAWSGKLHCSEGAMVIEYESDESTPVTGTRGSVSTAPLDEARNSVGVVVGEEPYRDRILAELRS
ncbi:hypothetical protein [Streptomyces sp. NPDC047108]|uniref:hypothetical protein n=1 Tax=Streptomyces sp. NPDC047108 TaxID=3155025 RepID=UPI0033DE77F4